MDRRNGWAHRLIWSTVCILATLLMAWCSSVFVTMDCSLYGRYAVTIRAGVVTVYTADLEALGSEAFAHSPPVRFVCLPGILRSICEDHYADWLQALGLRAPSWRSRVGWGVDTVVNIPLWLPVCLAIGALVLLRSIARRRGGDGRCTRCGYDLRHNVSGVCPECGRHSAGC